MRARTPGAVDALTWALAAVIAVVAGVAAAGVAAAQGGGSDPGSNSGKSPSTPPTTSAPAKLTARDADTVKRDFGEDRGAQTVTLSYDADHALTNAPAVSAGDAHTDKGRPFHGTVSATAQLVGGNAVNVPVTLDPADDARPDAYTIPLALRGPEIANKNGSLVVTLSRAPPLAVAWILALIALAIGIGAGGLLKWLADTGSKLHDLLAANERITAQLRGASPLPAALTDALTAARLRLMEGDTAGADTAFKALADGVAKLLPVLRSVNALGASLSAQEQLIRSMGADADTTSQLETAVDRERDRLMELRDQAWPDPAAIGDDLTTVTGKVNGFTAFLAAHQTADSRSDGNAQAFHDAVSRYAHGELDEAPPADAAARRAVAEVRAPGEGLGRRLRLPKPRFVPGALWLGANAPFIVGFLTAVGLALVGLATVFKPNTMFLTNDAADFLLLLLWGFGSALAGITVTDLAGKARGVATPS